MGGEFIMTKITQITDNEIFMYHDYMFIMFDRRAIIGGAEYIGWVWAIGKQKDSNKNIVEKIKRDTTYHLVLHMELARIVQKELIVKL